MYHRFDVSGRRAVCSLAFTQQPVPFDAAGGLLLSGLLAAGVLTQGNHGAGCLASAD